MSFYSNSSSPLVRMERIRFKLEGKNNMSTLRITKLLAATAAVLAVSTIASAAGKINVITATQDLAAIDADIGGDRITYASNTKGYQDPLFVEPKQRFVIKLHKTYLR